MKYFLKKNNEELKIGQTIELSTSVDTSYGPGVATTKVKVTEPVLKKLIDDGFVVEKEEDKKGSEATERKTKENIIKAVVNLKPYIKRFAKSNGLDLPEAFMFLSLIADASMIAHLDILIGAIAEVKNRDKTAKDEVYFLNPASDYKPTAVTRKHNGITTFADKADAEEAYKLLLPIIRYMLDGK